MQIVSRAGWNARSPRKKIKVDPSRREYFVVHHSGASAEQSVRAIQDWCMDGRGFSDIDYNFLVDQDGQVYEGRGWDVIGSHTANYNTSSAGICVIGDDEISDAAKRAVLWLYGQYNARCSKTLKIRGHRQLATTGTTCPGDRVYAWVSAGMPAPHQEDEMKLDDDQLDKIASAVWAKATSTPSTEKRWPGEKSMASFLMLAAMGGADAVKAIGALAGKDAVDEQALAVALVPLLASGDLETVIRNGLPEGERKALAARLAV